MNFIISSQRLKRDKNWQKNTVRKKRKGDRICFILTQTGQERTDATCVINKLQSVRSRHCPASGLKYRGVIIIYSRAHYDNTNHTISSSDLEPGDLIHLTWFSITHKHTVSKPPSQPGDKQRLLTLMLKVWEEIQYECLRNCNHV